VVSGREDVIPAMKQAFSDKEESVRRSVLSGVGHALDEDPLGETKTSAAFKAAMFDLIVTLVPHEPVKERRSVSDDFTYADAIKLLPRLMRSKAREHLQHPSLFRADNRDLYVILESLSNAGVSVSVDLDKYLTDTRPKALADEHPYPYLYGQLLRASATQKHPRARELIQDALEVFDDWTVPENAAEAQWILLGLSPSLDNDIFAHLDRAGPDKLAKPLQQYVIVSEYFYDAMNGGLSQYFFNTSASSIRANVIALNEMGATGPADEIMAALKLFGPKGPPADHQKQREMMRANNSALFRLIDAVKVPEDVKQTPENVEHKYETIVHAKLYLAKFPEICKAVPRYSQ